MTGEKSFYKLTVNKADGNVYAYSQSPTIKNNLTISSGNFSANGLTVIVGGSLNNSGGTFSQSGTFVFNSTNGSETIRSGDSQFNNVEFNGVGATFSALDTFNSRGDTKIGTGATFVANGQTLSFGDNTTDIVTIDGVLKIDENGTLTIGNGTSLTVNIGGHIYVVGSPGNRATVTSSSGKYYFLVNGTIHAQHYLFENMRDSGIQLSASSTIDATDNFSNGTFTNGSSGGTFLRIENTQTLTINNVSFPSNPGGASSNVMKTDAMSGVLTFDNASGAFAGEAFDEDPNDLIIWPTPIVLTWVGGTNTDWFTASNWSASYGPAIVPTGAENVIINSATNQPVINTAGAKTNNITINTGAKLTLNTAKEPDQDFVINGNLSLSGTLSVTSANDTIYVAGGWDNTSGTFIRSEGTVIFNGVSGSFNINNTGASFYNLTIDGLATYSLATNTLVQNTLNIVSGTLDASSNNYSLSVDNEWLNTGVFNPRSGTVILTSKKNGIVPLRNGSSKFYNLTIDGDSSTQFQTNANMSINSNFTINNSTFDLNGKTMVMGDGTGTDILSVSGTFKADANAVLRMGAGAKIDVKSNGLFRLVGQDDSNIATITRNTSGSYSVVVESGGKLEARYYSIGYLGTNGLQMNAGSVLGNTPENLSDGTFTNGASGGRYIEMLKLTNDHTIRKVVFNAGPAKNVKATSDTNNFVEFEDASGLLAGANYEEDDGIASTGYIRWTSTSTRYTWIGLNGTDWNNLSNWVDSNNLTPLSLSDQTIDIVIPNTANKPVISSNAEANNLTIQTGGNLTLKSNKDLFVAGNFTNGGTFSIPDGSASSLIIGDSYSNAGTVSFGNQSTVELQASSGIKSLTFGNSSLQNLTLNGKATFNLTSALTVKGNLTISDGSLDVTASNYQITVGGDWMNNGIFTSRGGLVLFDGNASQSIYAGGLTSEKQFNKIRIAKTGTITLASDTFVKDEVNLYSGTINLSNRTLEVGGAWSNTNVTVVPSTSTVVFSGSNSIAMSANSQSFNNLTVKKTGSNQVYMLANAIVNGTLSVEDGTFYLNGKRLDYGDGADNMSIDGTLYADQGSILGMHQSSSLVVNSGGVLRITGSNASSVATVTRRAATSGWKMTINGTLKSKFAVFEYSGGNGITLGASATLDATENLSNTVFRNGTGTSYIKAEAAINSKIDDIIFETGPTYNISATAGNIEVHNYEGTLAGARFENDNGPTHPGFVKWTYDKTLQTNTIGTYNFGNEVILNLTNVSGGLTETRVVYLDDIYQPGFNVIPRMIRMVYTGGTASGSVSVAYAGNELGDMVEDDLKIWIHKGGLDWKKVAATVNKTSKTLTVSNYTFGEGTADATIPLKSKPNNGDDLPELLDGSEHWVISDVDDEESLPVELTDFSIDVDATRVGKTVLAWTTASEKENYGFYLSRSYLGFEYESQIDGFSARRDTSWTELTFVQGRGNSTEEVNYTFTDDSIQEAGNYLYRLTQMDFDGKVKAYDPIEYHYAGPEKFELKQNYPNPFNPTTIIPYNVAKRVQVRIDVYNILGQRVQTLVNEVRNPGSYRIGFNGMAYSSGMYLIRYSADGKMFVKKMMLIK